MHDGVKKNVKRPVEQSFMQSWDCSHIENEEEKESWREGDQMAAQWDEKQKLEDILERRRTEGSPCSWRLCTTQLSYLCTGWSMKKMKRKLSIAMEEDTEEVKNGEV